MKLQASAGALRLRLSVAEFRTLRDGDSLVLQLPFPGAPLAVLLAAGEEVAFETIADTRDVGPGRCIAIRLPHADLAMLASRLPCRDGLEYRIDAADGGPVRVVIDVDIRDPDGRRTAPR